MPPDDPLWDVPGILITPHIASEPSNATIAAQFVESLRRWRRGEPPLNLIDRSRGY
jgi:glyoxylate/hydroxypyruvate reductase A